MAIITYQCDTCHRSVDLPQNRLGFEVYSNCIITLNCKGNLVYVSAHPEYVRGSATPIDPTLTDWVQRLILYTHEQIVPATVWKVKHGLNNKPDVNVFVYDTNNTLVRFTPTSVTYPDVNTVKITLPLKYTGVIECIAKYSNMSDTTPVVATDTLIQISNTNHLTFAISRQYKNPVLNLAISTASVNSSSINATVPLSNNNSLLPWGNTSVVYFNGKNYNVYTVDLPAIIPDNITSAYAVTVTSLSTDLITDSPIIDQKGLVWILLSSGNTYNDKKLTSIVDVTSLTSQNNITTNNITSVNSSIITDMYPPIKIT